MIAALLLTFNLSSQTFRAAPIAGFNLAQIDGDNLAGYHKFGLHVGAKAYAKLNEQLSIGVELLYSQKGSRENRRIYFQGEDFIVNLEYAEIPVLLHYHDKHGMIFGLGLSYNNLLKQSGFTYGPNNPLTEPVEFETWDLNFLADLAYVINDHYAINIRYAYSILPIGHYEFSEFNNNRVGNNLLSFRFMYIFGK